tara:strand:- start:21537 stop:22754 length:1218 start_codon:yes stop_codon:yes gene_type:complete
MADIFFPSFNEALPEPDAGLPVQSGSGSLASAFEGLMSGSTAIAKSYTDLNNARNKAEQAALNLDALDRPEEAEYLRGLGSTAFANPFKPDQNENLIAETEKLFSSTTSALRKAKADIDLQAARDAAANERILTSGSEAIKLQDKRTEGGLILGAQDLGNKIHLQSIENEFKADQEKLNRQQKQFDRDTVLDQTEMREVSDIHQTNQRIRAAQAKARAKEPANNNPFSASKQITPTVAGRIAAYAADPDTVNAGSPAFMKDIVNPLMSAVDETIAAEIGQARANLVKAQTAFAKSDPSSDEYDELDVEVQALITKFREVTRAAAKSVVARGDDLDGNNTRNGLPLGSPGAPSSALFPGQMVFPQGYLPVEEDDDFRPSDASVTFPDKKTVWSEIIGILSGSNNNE